VWRKNVFDIYFRSYNTSGDSGLLMEMGYDRCSPLLTEFVFSGMPVLFPYFHGNLFVFSSGLFIVVLVLLIGIQTDSLFEWLIVV
jgi:hypothetical protein